MSDYPHTLQVKSKPKGARLFQRALVGEFVSNGLLVFAVLFAIVVVSQLIRLLGAAVDGKIAVEAVLALLGFGAMSYLPMLFSICLFISILLTLSRCYRDSEMVVWFCSGVGLTKWIRPVMVYALPVVAMIALLSLVLSPWSVQKAEQFKHKLENRDDVATATTGTFRESKQSDRVYFIEDMDLQSGRVGNIFVQSVQNGKMGTIVARQGFQETKDDGTRFLVLINGTRYEGTPGQRDYNIVEFERYSMRIDSVPAKQSELEPAGMSTWSLWNDPTSWNIAELQRRISLPISAVIIALLAIPMGYVNPRAGRSINLIFAVVVYMLYSNMINVANSWVGLEKVSPATGMWMMHAVMLGATVLMFYRRMKILSLRKLFGKFRKVKQATPPGSDSTGPDSTIPVETGRQS
ncbi:MAG: LPS export ABC transporter permease LptF [Gallionella sp.]